MELINLKGLNLTMEESRDIIKFIAQKRAISTKKLFSTIKLSLKRKNNEILTTKTQLNIAKIQQKVAKTLQKVAKTQQKSFKLQKRKNTQNLAYEKPLKLAKRKNLTPQKPLETTKRQILSKTKKRIEIIREKLK